MFREAATIANIRRVNGQSVVENLLYYKYYSLYRAAGIANLRSVNDQSVVFTV